MKKLTEPQRNMLKSVRSHPFGMLVRPGGEAYAPLRRLIVKRAVECQHLTGNWVLLSITPSGRSILDGGRDG